MEGETAAKRRKLEHHRGLSDADAPGLSSFHMEDLPEVKILSFLVSSLLVGWLGESQTHNMLMQPALHWAFPVTSNLAVHA